MNRSVYIHIPFCHKRCDYCDFYSTVNEFSQGEYVDLLLKEIDLYPNSLKEAYSIYFGGGTPSALKMESLERIFRHLERKTVLKPKEMTFEANPESITEEQLIFLKDQGVTRISLGVQSMEERVLEFLGRAHGVKEVLQALDLIFQVGFQDVSVDFIYGIEGIETNLSHSLSLLDQYPIDHVSCYPLEVYEHLPIALKTVNSQDKAADEYRILCKILEEKGFHQYEISNFGRNGAKGLHNSHYWKPGEYYGFGLSAHGYIDGIRYANTSSFEKYRESVEKGEKPLVQENPLSLEEKEEEYIFLRLRTDTGISAEEFKELFHKDFYQTYQESIHKHLEKGNLQQRGGHFRLTPSAMFIMNHILEDFLS